MGDNAYGQALTKRCHFFIGFYQPVFQFIFLKMNIEHPTSNIKHRIKKASITKTRKNENTKI